MGLSPTAFSLTLSYYIFHLSVETPLKLIFPSNYDPFSDQFISSIYTQTPVASSQSERQHVPLAREASREASSALPKMPQGTAAVRS